MPPVLRRLVPIFGLTLGLVLASAGVASAHTGWKPDAAAPGSIASLTLSVAAENDAAGTVKVELFFPEGVELTTVEPTAPAGWAVETGPPGGTGANVTWSRPSGPSSESPQLPIRLGTFPAQPGQIQFKVIQTYADGTVARWIADWPAGAPEPEMPGPVLKLEPGAAGDIPPSTTTTSAPATTTTTGLIAPNPEVPDDDGGSDSTGLIIGAVALFLVALGVTATIVLRRNQAKMNRPDPPEPPEGVG
jgi:uncharacterized protein YcnI